MNRLGIVRGWWTRPGADLLDVAWPTNGKSLVAPNSLKQLPIWPLRGAIDLADDIGQPHFDRIRGRTFRLFSGRIAKASPRRAHIPEISADQIALTRIVVKYGR
jgi:hypothetical protein